MSEDILKIMEAIREEAKEEDATTLDTMKDTEKRTGYKPGDLSWKPPTPAEEQGPGPVTGTGTADDPYVFGRGTVIRVKKEGAQEGDAPEYEGTVGDLVKKAAGAAAGGSAEEPADITMPAMHITGKVPGSDFYKQGLLAPDVRAIVPADWSAPGGRGDLPEEPASWK